MTKVNTTVDGHVFVIEINRPEVRNAVDGESADLLRAAWERFRTDEDLWVAVLTGSGDKAFCAGADLGALDSLGPDREASPQTWRRFVSHGDGYLGGTRFVDIYKPIIAAVNGDALAGGLELACLADLRVVEAHAQMGVACRRFNVPLCDGGTQRLPRIIGLGWAMELILTGRFIDANEAHRMGLANEVVPRGEGRQRAMELARELCRLPQGAMRTDKEAALRGLNEDLESGLRIEAELSQWAIFGQDMHEGARAFKEKRAPAFSQED
jgi:enoyl-CoA hydratase